MRILRPGKVCQLHVQVIHGYPAVNARVGINPVDYLCRTLLMQRIMCCSQAGSAAYGASDNPVSLIELAYFFEILAVFPITCDHYISSSCREYIIQYSDTICIKRFPGSPACELSSSGQAGRSSRDTRHGTAHHTVMVQEDDPHAARASSVISKLSKRRTYQRQSSTE